MIVEDLAAGGIDTLRSFASVDIASNGGIENVTLCGTADLEATANGLSNVFVGNSGDNALDGDSGADTLRGGHGRDVLAGGLASHTFVFRTGDGKDVVTDFNARFFGSDLLDLSGVKGIADFNNLIENHVRQVGDDLVVDANGSDRIRLENTAAADLTANMFVL